MNAAALIVFGAWAVALVCVACALCAGHADGRDRALRLALRALGEMDHDDGQEVPR